MKNLDKLHKPVTTSTSQMEWSTVLLEQINTGGLTKTCNK